MKKRLTSKLIAVLLTFAIMVLVLPMPQVSAATTENGFEFEEYAFGVKITGYTGGGGAVVVPEKINGKNVVEIGYRAFFNKLNITSVTLPNTVITIGAYAFGICENLAGINIPDSVISIGARAFEYCKSLHNIEFGKGVQVIGDNAFTSCNGLTSVSLPPLMTKIYDSAFYACQNLAEVTIPAGVTQIETCAFRGCSLKDIYFLGDAPAIAWDAFPPSFNGEFTGLMHFYQHSTGFTLGTWSPPQNNPNDIQIYHTVFLANYNGAVLSNGSAIRTSDTTAMVKFTSDKAGWSFDEVVEPGVTPPAIYASGKGRDCTIGENTFNLTAQDGLTAGARNIYVKVKDLDGNGSPLLKIELPAYGAQPAPTVTKVDPNNGPDTGGTTVAITGTGLSTVSAVKFGSKAATKFTLGNDTSMTAVSPAGSGTVDVTVYSPDSGWSTVNASDKFTYTASPLTYTITYNGNGSTGGTVPVDSTTYTQGTIVTVLGNTGNLVRTGYTFGGWNTKADGSGTNYAAGATFVMGSANVTLYAKWIYTIEITDNTVPVTISIPASITDAVIDVSSLLSSAGSTLSGKLPSININVITSMSTEPVEVAIPAGTIVSAPIESGWNGTIHVPTIKEIKNEDLGLSNKAKVDSVVEIGFNNIPLTFDKAVRLVFPGKAGKRIGYSRNGVFTEITTKLATDTQEAGDALAVGQEGKIDVDSDLVVWSKHFTYFALYTLSSSGGGGGSTVNPGPIVMTPERLAGNDRFETAIAIAEQGWETGADNVVLVNAYNFPDALAAVPLAKKLNAPILLTDKAEIALTTLAEIKKLNAKKITLIGGIGVISQNIQDSLSATYGQNNVIRCGGANRYATAAKIAAALGSSDKAVIANGEDGHYPDAFAVSSYAAYHGIPILFTETAKLHVATAQVLTDQKVKTTIVVGGEGAVSSGVFNQLPGAARYGGADRYATAAAINNGLQLKCEQVYVVTGLDFPDALVAGNLAAYSQSPVLMVDKKLPEATRVVLRANKAVIKKLTIIGGKGVITPALESNILNALI